MRIGNSVARITPNVYVRPRYPQQPVKAIEKIEPRRQQNPISELNKLNSFTPLDKPRSLESVTMAMPDGSFFVGTFIDVFA